MRYTPFILVTVLLLAVLTQIDWKERVSISVLDLLPPGREGQAELGLARGLMQEKSTRVMLFALRSQEPSTAEEAALQLATTLNQSGLFEDVVLPGDAIKDNEWSRRVFENRLPLFFPQWLASAEANRDGMNVETWAAHRLKAFLRSPEYPLFKDTLAADPLLLFPHLFSIAAGKSLLPGGQETGLVWARQKPSPFLPEGQEPVISLIENFRNGLPADVALTYTGVNRFAQESRDEIESEIQWISSIGLSIALLIALAGLRSFRLMLHLFVPVILAIPIAFLCGLLLFGKIHLLALALGSIIFGVAVDYGFHTVLHHRAGESYRSTLRRIRLPLLLGMLTSVTGFLFLLWSDLPVLRQMGLLVGCGLGFSLVAIALYLPLVTPPPISIRRPPLVIPKWIVFALIFLCIIAAIPGWIRLQWRDSLADMEIPLPELMQNEAAIQSLFGQDRDSAMVLTGGASLADAIHQTQQLNGSLSPEAFNLPMVLPTQQDVTKADKWLRGNPDFTKRFADALKKEGFKEGAFEEFFNLFETYATQQGQTAGVFEVFLEGLPGPIQDLWQSDGENFWFITTLPKDQLPAAETLGAISLNQARTLERVMTLYRASSIRLALIGFACMSVLLPVCMGLRRGLGVMLIPVLSLLLTMGILSLCQGTLNLFSVIGFLLAFCLSVDYAIFTMFSLSSNADAEHRQQGLFSVRLSAATTSASFLVLGFSRINALESLGLSVAVMAILTLLLCEGTALIFAKK